MSAEEPARGGGGNPISGSKGTRPESRDASPFTGGGQDADDLDLGLGLGFMNEEAPPARSLRPRRGGGASAAVLAELSEDDFEAELEAEERAADAAAAAAAAVHSLPQPGRQHPRRTAAAAAAAEAAEGDADRDAGEELGPGRTELNRRTRKRSRSPGWTPVGPRVPKRARGAAPRPRRSFVGWARRFGAAPAAAARPAQRKPLPEAEAEPELSEPSEGELDDSPRAGGRRGPFVFRVVGFKAQRKSSLEPEPVGRIRGARGRATAPRRRPQARTPV